MITKSSIEASALALAAVLLALPAAQAEDAGSPWGALAAVAPSNTADDQSNALKSTDPEDVARHMVLTPAAEPAAAAAASPPAAPETSPSAASPPAREDAGAASVAPEPVAAATPAQPAPDQAAATPQVSTPAVATDSPSDAAAQPSTAVASVAPQSGSEANAAPASQPHAVEASLDLNKASETELNRLSGARHLGHAIVAHRPYRSVQDLKTRRILRESDFVRIRGHVKV